MRHDTQERVQPMATMPDQQIASSRAVLGLCVKHHAVPLLRAPPILNLVNRSRRIANVYVMPTDTTKGHDTLRKPTIFDLGQSQDTPLSPSKERCQQTTDLQFVNSKRSELPYLGTPETGAWIIMGHLSGELAPVAGPGWPRAIVLSKLCGGAPAIPTSWVAWMSDTAFRLAAKIKCSILNYS
ncbi:hypothetical protein CORC01_12173 [Colletotrichum orchidophilum]|uniref:Uncharacterized protein n=1 Tax=Colletotrichum orchidophilum TaxID=1209926 RepID=A0A1G4ATN6_9PEZI|nr:uncharacterized protein CORC01_12173 [Colletotrichum orchidophilum]OHE92524.1 hypothetical protein CORC01_12173 [Colletotrichum orchidophilum]